MKSKFLKLRVVGIFVTILWVAAIASAQTPATESEGFGMTYLLLIVAVMGAGAAFLFWQRSKKGGDQPDLSYKNRYQNYYSKSAGHNVVGDQELEWLRKARNSGPTGCARAQSTRSGPRR